MQEAGRFTIVSKPTDANGVVAPTLSDSLVADGSEVIGGPLGRLVKPGSSWTPVRVLIVLGTLAYLLGYLLDASCRSDGWASPERYEHLCYSDIPPLFSLRGFADGLVPYFEWLPGERPLEYPVLTGLFMWGAAIVTKMLVGVFDGINESQVVISTHDRAVAFFDVNVAGLFIAFIVTVIATALTVRRRPWDAAMVALAPTMILAATINWDLLAIAFAALALLAWSRSRTFVAGLMLGLAIAAKFYPVVFLGGFLVLAIRTGKWRDAGRLFAGTIIGWLVVNLPFAVLANEGWRHFYEFSSERGQDFGSFWYAITLLGVDGVPAASLNLVATGLLVIACAGIAVLVLGAQRRPRLAQVLFLIVAAFIVTNKVYSPQYVLWLVPLAVLARPRWRDFLIWQAGELVYFAAIWWYLVGYGIEDTHGLTQQWYAVAVFVHIAATLWLAGMVVRDILDPSHDPVRTDGMPANADDPGGGPFDQAPDIWTLRRH